jgi:hypothetical protein
LILIPSDLLRKLTEMRIFETEMAEDELAQFLMDLFKAKDIELQGQGDDRPPGKIFIEGERLLILLSCKERVMIDRRVRNDIIILYDVLQAVTVPFPNSSCKKLLLQKTPLSYYPQSCSTKTMSSSSKLLFPTTPQSCSTKMM